MNTEPIPFYTTAPMHGQCHEGLLHAFSQVSQSEWFVMGGRLAAFERAYANYLGVAHCIGVGNGFDALKIGLMALGIGPGDEVVVPAHTFAACPMAIAEVGATPVMADVLDVNGCIDPQQVEMVLTPRTRCIMPVHLYGFPCDMDALMQLANSHGIYVLEDNAQAQGATWKGQKTGSIGHLAATSFYPTKNLGALGDGGALTTQLESLSTRILALRNYGSSQKYDHREVGVNSRLDELQAAFLQVKLPLLNTWNAERAKLAGYYTEALRGIPGLQLPEAMPGSEPAFHLFPIRVTLRNALAQYLAQQGIGTRIHYPLPNHLQPAFAYLGYQKGDFPVAEAIAATTLSLPLYPGLNEELVARVTAAIRHFFQS